MKVLKQIIKDHIEYKKQIMKLAKSDLVKTYRGSALRMGMGNNQTSCYYICILVCIRDRIKSKQHSKWISIFSMVNSWTCSMVLYGRHDNRWDKLY